MAAMATSEERQVSSAHSARLPSLPVADGRSVMEVFTERSDAESDRLPVVEIKPFMHQEWRPSRSLPDYYDKCMTFQNRSKENTYIDPIALGVSTCRGSEFGSRESLVGNRPQPTPRFKPREAKQVDMSRAGIFATTIDREKTTVEEMKNGPSGGPSGIIGVQRALSEVDLVRMQDMKVQGSKMEDLPPKVNMFYLTPWEYYRLHRSYHIPNGVVPGTQNPAQAVVDEINMRYGGALENVYLDDSIYDTFDRSNTLPSIRVSNAPTRRKRAGRKNGSGSALSKSLPGSGIKSNIYKLGVANSLDVLRNVGRPAAVESHLSSHLKHTIEHVRRTRDPQSVLGTFVPTTLSRGGLRTEGAPTLGEAMIRQGQESNNPKKSGSIIQQQGFPSKSSTDGITRPLYRLIHETYGIEPPNNNNSSQKGMNRRLSNTSMRDKGVLEGTDNVPLTLMERMNADSPGKHDRYYSAPMEDGNNYGNNLKAHATRTPQSTPLTGAQQRESLDYRGEAMPGEMTPVETATTSRASRRSREGRASRGGQGSRNRDAPVSTPTERQTPSEGGGGGILKKRHSAETIENPATSPVEDRAGSVHSRGSRTSGRGPLKDGTTRGSSRGSSRPRSKPQMDADNTDDAFAEEREDGERSVQFEDGSQADQTETGGKSAESASRAAVPGGPDFVHENEAIYQQALHEDPLKNAPGAQEPLQDAPGAVKSGDEGTVAAQEAIVVPTDKIAASMDEEETLATETRLSQDREAERGDSPPGENAQDDGTTAEVQKQISADAGQNGDGGQAGKTSGQDEGGEAEEVNDGEPTPGKAPTPGESGTSPAATIEGASAASEVNGGQQNDPAQMRASGSPSAEDANNNGEHVNANNLENEQSNQVIDNDNTQPGEDNDTENGQQSKPGSAGEEVEISSLTSPGSRQAKHGDDEVKGIKLPPSATTRKHMTASAASKASTTSFTGDAVYITNWDQKTETESIMRPETVLTMGEIPDEELEDEQ